MPAFVQNYLPHYGQPDADVLEDLSAAIIVDQQRIGGNARSTVGTYTDAYTMLRVLFSRVGEPSAGTSNRYSFNDPAGMCPTCEGIGWVAAVDEAALLDDTKSLNDGAIDFPNFAVGSWYWKVFIDSGFFDPDQRVGDFTPELREKLLYAPRVQGQARPRLQADEHDLRGPDPEAEAALPVQGARRPAEAPPRRGRADQHPARVRRLRRHADSTPPRSRRRINNTNIADCASMETRELATFIRTVDRPDVKPLVDALARRLEHLDRIGLGYLSLDRPSATLCGGESQRVKLVRHLGSSLTGMTYIFDEPSIGLHPHDVHRLNELLRPDPRQGQHGAGGRARAGRDLGRRPRRRHGPGRGPRGRHGRLHRRRRGAEKQRHADRQALRPPPAAEDRDPRPRRRDPDRQRVAAQPRRRQRQHPARRADRGHGRRGLRQEQPDPRPPAAGRAGGEVDRPAPEQRQPALEPGHLHGHAGRHPQGVRASQQGPRLALQRQLRRRLPGLQGARRRLHRPRAPRPRDQRLRALRGQALHRRGAPAHPPGRQHRRRLRHAGRRRARLLHREADPQAAGGDPATSASAT